jgi:hypothetical protein
MTDYKRKHGPQDEPDLPERLVEDLAELYRPPSGVPGDMDGEILFAAREQLGNARRSWRWGLVGVIAASIALVFGIELIMQPRWSAQHSDTLVQREAPAVVREDIDRSGRVDILDAFLLARCIDTDGNTKPEWDVNGDGNINQADVDAVALTAVRLNGGAS